MQDQLSRLISEYEHIIRLTSRGHIYQREQNNIITIVADEIRIRLMLFTIDYSIIWCNKDYVYRRNRVGGFSLDANEEECKMLIDSLVYYMNEIDERLYVFPEEGNIFSIKTTFLL